MGRILSQMGKYLAAAVDCSRWKMQEVESIQRWTAGGWTKREAWKEVVDQEIKQ